MKKCYWCGEPATSKEHVPPKCLFPERKDVNDIYNKNFRTSLITVPSCEEHNLKKSQDDEYLMACLAPNFGNNGIAYIHTQTKVRRAAERNKKLYKVVGYKTIKVRNKKFPMMIIQTDTYRLVRSFEAIGRALYFYTHNKQFSGICKIIPTFIKDQKQNSRWNQFCDWCISLVQSERNKWTEYGNNPDIFKYQFGEEDEVGCQMLLMTFYGHLEVYVVFANNKAIDTLKLKK